MAGWCRNRRTRTSEFTNAIPTKWNPGEVYNPESGMGFSDVAAWDFVATLIEDGFPMHAIELDLPEGRTAYEMLVPKFSKDRDLYIKVMPDGNRIYGRSFHYSTVR